MGEDFPADERLDAAFLKEGNLLGVPQVAVRFVFDDALLAADGRLKQTAQRSGSTFPALWIFLITGGAVSSLSAFSLRALISFGE